MKAFRKAIKECSRQEREDQEAEALAGKAVELIITRRALDKQYGVDPHTGAELFWNIQHHLLAFLRDPSGFYQQPLQ